MSVIIIKTPAVPQPIFPRDENGEGEEQRKWKGKICAANNENRTRIEALLASELSEREIN